MRDPEIDRRFRQLFDMHDTAIEKLRAADEGLVVTHQSLNTAAQALITIGQAILTANQDAQRVFRLHDEATRAALAASRGAIELLAYLQNGNEPS
jgi:hypothetical protein